MVSVISGLVFEHLSINAICHLCLYAVMPEMMYFRDELVQLIVNRLWVQLPAVHCWVSTWMGEPSRYVTSHLGQLSLPSLWGR